jgi:hypothetical protein
MNCKEFRNALLDATMPQAITPQVADAAAWANHEHLAHCPACAARLDQWRKDQQSQIALQRGLRALAGQMSRTGAPPRVEAGLREAFRSGVGPAAVVRANLRRADVRRADVRTDTRSSPSIRARGRWIPVFTGWIPVLNGAAAAAALFAVAVFLTGGRQPRLVSSAVSSGVEVAVAGMPVEIETEGSTTVAESGFIPLPNAAQIGPNEEVNLVRVEVPRSAMIALGYDVKPEEATESVQADVMLGTDGMARAVRFLD